MSCSERKKKKKCKINCIYVSSGENGNNGVNGLNGSNGPPGITGPPGPPGIPTTMGTMVFSAIPPSAQGTTYTFNQVLPFSMPLLENTSVAQFQLPANWILSPGYYLISIFLNFDTQNSFVLPGEFISLTNSTTGDLVGVPHNINFLGNSLISQPFLVVYNYQLILNENNAGSLDIRYQSTGGTIGLCSLPPQSENLLGSWMIQKLS